MKFSRFNVWSLNDQGLILFNTLTCALALFEKEHAKTAHNALEKRDPVAIPSDFIDGMVEDGYLVADNCDEFRSIQKACQERRSKTDECFLCVILTMRCNFKCLYCFEEHRDEDLSGPETEKVKKMLKKLTSTARKIEVDWFGGEPLISFDVLHATNDLFMDIARSSGVEYSHSITTNGFLLNDEVIKYLAATPLSLLTITLDGPPDIQDRFRPLKKGGQTFWTVFNNIRNAVESGLKVSIRVNVTNQNSSRILELYKLLEQHGLKNKVEVNLQAVVSSPANPCESICLSGRDFAGVALGIYKQAAKDGWIVLPPTEKMKALGFCVSEYPNRLITDLRGNLYRCGQMFETGSVGSLGEDGSIILDAAKNEMWVDKNPLQFAECRDCAVLPICMGGCNMKRFVTGTDYCLNWKHNMSGLLEVIVLNEENIRRQNA